MRVIAGFARRTALVAPVGLSTRPTSDRCKENLFNILGEQVRGARVLDIFCGSGAIGIEALSRGAEKAVFVDCDSSAVKAVKTNLLKTKLSANALVLEMLVEQAVKRLSAEKFNIIFLDPPYNSQQVSEILAELFPLLDEDGLIVAETHIEFVPPKHNEGNLADTRIYGQTKFLFYKMDSI